MRDKKSILLGGPIQHAMHREGAFDDHLKKAILRLINILEGSGYQVFSAHVAENFGDLTPSTDSTQIVTRDYHWMQLCDVYVAIFPRKNSGEYVRSDGTHIEIGWASAFGKPIILLGDGVPNQENSHLLRGLRAITSMQFVAMTDIEYNPQPLLNAIQNAINSSASLQG